MSRTSGPEDPPPTGPATALGKVEVIEAAPYARRSRSHRVRVLGTPVFVGQFAGVSYSRFAMRGPVVIEIDTADPIVEHAVFPAGRAGSAVVAGTTLRLDLAAPEAVVIRIDRLEPLFLLPDPIDDAPSTGPSTLVTVTEFGADPTGRALATRRLQAAIDHAGQLPGGGTVVLPRGVFRSGTLTLRSNVTLHLAAGAVLQGSSDPADYPVDPGRRESAGDESLAPDVRYLGRTMTYSRLLLVDRADNVRITGHGTIDGNGAHLRGRHGIAPNLIRVRESTNVSIEDVLFRDAAAWTIHVLACRDVAIRNIKVINDRSTLNTDGIDLDMSSDVTVDRSFIYTKDDAICVKATGNSDLVADPQRILISRNVVSSLDAGLKLGSESAASTFSDIIFEDNDVFDTGRAMSLVVRDGATYERVTFRRIRVGSRVDHLVEQVIGVRDPAAGLGAVRNLTFDDVTASAFERPASNWTWYAQYRPGRPGPDTMVPAFEGADERHAVDGLRLRGFVVNGRRLTDAETARRVANLTIGPNVRGVTFE
jgi:hypothetical protein